MIATELVIKEMMTECIGYSVRSRKFEGICYDLFEDFGLGIWHRAYHDELAAPTITYVPRR